MDEPTSGLDARAAAIVMRAVRNTVNKGRTVVCTIHQPSINIFEAFDELFLIKLGGEEIYVGPLGDRSCHLVEYFQNITGVHIRDGYNPATWMLEVTSTGQEEILGVNFAEAYKNSEMYRTTKVLVGELSKPHPGSKDLNFATRYPQHFLQHTRQDLFDAMGSMCNAVFFVGIQNTITVQPLMDAERRVFYREKAAGMYSSYPYAAAQVIIEIPYIFLQSVMFMTLSPNCEIAAVVSSAFYGIWSIFSGFVIPYEFLFGGDGIIGRTRLLGLSMGLLHRNLEIFKKPWVTPMANLFRIIFYGTLGLRWISWKS
ncbi:hypothetical protein ACP70R_037215 [Stipagrostis hirtigluma subsp. patula]